MKIQAVLMHPIDHQQLQSLPGKTEESRGAEREEGTGQKNERQNEGGRKTKRDTKKEVEARKKRITRAHR